ncbi:TPA: hypothetical protein ACKPFZ_001646 [Pseudomonas aeruginosa]
MSIQSDIKDLLDYFERSAQGLFELSGRYENTYEQGIYGCAIAKPTKRMKNALAVDRELLVVCSTFKDQQQRTIRFIKEEIERSQGRYESNIAIVIHRDSDGNTKLKNWARDLGITLLPLRDLTSSTTSADLERSLCFELYSHDPFDVTGPVSDDSNFYGRREEAIDLARKLQTGQIRSCLGIRKIGKTSIINRILKEIRSNHHSMCLMIDCSRDDVWELSASQLLTSIAESLKNLGNEGYSSISPSKNNRDLRSAREELEKIVINCDLPVILIFDEVDYITPGSPTNSAWMTEFNPFWRNLRSVYQECERQAHKLSLLVGGVSTYWFTIESIGNIENAALSFVPEEYMSPMPEGATVAMLKRLGKIAGLQFDESVAEAIARATGNMPYWARKCSSFIHRHIPTSERPCVVDLNKVAPLIESFVAEEGAAMAEVSLQHLFRVHPGLQEATRQCAAGQAANVPEPLRRKLRQYGVLARNDGLAGAVITKGFGSLGITTATEDAIETKISNEKGALNDWAEEIAALGKRRNLLERRLREIAINFVRFDALSSGKQSDVKQRILSILPEQQRISLQNFTAEDVIAKFLWTDLVKLIEKEWRLFEKILGDKSKFRSNADVINDRFDAHAKNADAADFALYRRALTQIEDRLSTIQ